MIISLEFIIQLYVRIHNLVVNSKVNNFESFSEYIINLSDNEVTAEYVLEDLIPYNLKELSSIKIKKCFFVEENSEKFNLKWKKSQNKLTNLKKCI